MAPDYAVHEALVLHADHLRAILAAHSMSAPRVAGLVAAGRPLPTGVPIEVYVDVAGAHDHYAAGMASHDREIADLVGHPVVICHCPVGQEGALPGESVRPL